jgi:L-iditol 2-dehydrogenase
MSTAMMSAATYTQGGTFAVREVPIPEPGAGEVVVRVTAAAICATDLKIIRNGHRKLAAGQRIVLGHEFCGTIAATGAGVEGLAEGLRVGVAPNAGCGVCPACTRGAANYCQAYTAFGINRDGSHAAFVRVPAAFVRQGSVVPLTDAVGDRDAALIEPISCVVNSIRACRIEPGDTLVLYGTGPMGRLHILLARLSGAGKIIVIDPNESRLPGARALGADVTATPGTDNGRATVLRETNGRGADVAVVACPMPDVPRDALTVLAPFGRLVLFAGLAQGVVPLPLDTNAIHYRNLVVTGTTGGNVDDYRRALALVTARRLDPGVIVAAEFTLDELEAAYRTALGGVDGKIVLKG